MYYLIAIIGGKLWWIFCKGGEITDWDQLPILGKIGYKMFMFSAKHFARVKTEEEVAILMQKLVEEKGLT